MDLICLISALRKALSDRMFHGDLARRHAVISNSTAEEGIQAWTGGWRTMDEDEDFIICAARQMSE
jgi:hypothetical protein